jgi:hypothetical protein
MESAAIVGVVVFGLAFYSSLTISETHNKDLEFTNNLKLFKKIK